MSKLRKLRNQSLLFLAFGACRGFAREDDAPSFDGAGKPSFTLGGDSSGASGGNVGGGGSFGDGNGRGGAATQDVFPMPTCELRSPLVWWAKPVDLIDLSVADRGDGLGNSIYALDGAQQLSSFSIGSTSSDGVSSVWECYDFLPKPERIASAVPSFDHLPDSFVTTAAGRIFFREVQPALGTWAPWRELSAPHPGEELQDVAVTASLGPSVLLVLSNGSAYRRNRFARTPDTHFGPWQALPPVNGARIAGVVEPSGGLVTYVVGLTGEVLLCPDSCESFAELAAPPFEILDVQALLEHEHSVLYALGPAGSVARWADDSWVTVFAGGPELHAFSARTWGASEEMTFYGVNETSIVWTLRAPFLAWKPVETMPPPN